HLLVHDLAVLDHESPQLLADEAAEKEVVLPAREAVARVERDAARRERGRPLDDGALHSRRFGLVADRRAVVVDAVGHRGPAVVLPGLDAVELVAAARAVLGLPELPRDGVERETLRVAVAVAPDRRVRSGPADEGVVFRRAAVVHHAVHLARGPREA